jgi:hypothetical protein
MIIMAYLLRQPAGRKAWGTHATLLIALGRTSFFSPTVSISSKNVKSFFIRMLKKGKTATACGSTPLQILDKHLYFEQMLKNRLSRMSGNEKEGPGWRARIEKLKRWTGKPCGLGGDATLSPLADRWALKSEI